jgi:hypothetical protein
MNQSINPIDVSLHAEERTCWQLLGRQAMIVSTSNLLLLLLHELAPRGYVCVYKVCLCSMPTRLVLHLLGAVWRVAGWLAGLVVRVRRLCACTNFRELRAPRGLSRYQSLS